MLRRCSGLSSVARIGAALAWCGLLLLAGCGKSDPRPRFTVQGKVTLDGQPLTGGTVHFVHILQAGENLPPNASLASIGELGNDGSFNLRTPVGKYRVRLASGEKSDSAQWARLPGLYTKDDSPLVVEVVENKPEGGYDIQLSSKEKPKRNLKGSVEERRNWRKGNKK